MKRRRIAFSLFLVMAIAAAYYFAGIFSEKVPKTQGPAGFIEPTQWRPRLPFLVTNLTIQPAEVKPNETVTVTVSVTSRHDAWGVYGLVLIVDGRKELESQASLDAGSTQNVSFEVTRGNPGRYRVSVNELTGFFTVVTERPIR